MTPKMKICKQSFNVVALALFIATCILFTKYNTTEENFSADQFLEFPHQEDLPLTANDIGIIEDKLEDKNSENNDEFHQLFSAATSGKEFSGEKFRTFPNHRRKFTENQLVKKVKRNHYNSRNCSKWAVVTTIFSPPQESVRRFLYRPDWCVVVVGDKNKPKVSFKNEFITILCTKYRVFKIKVSTFKWL